MRYEKATTGHKGTKKCELHRRTKEQVDSPVQEKVHLFDFDIPIEPGLVDMADPM